MTGSARETIAGAISPNGLGPWADADAILSALEQAGYRIDGPHNADELVGDVEPHDDVEKTVRIVRGGYGWTLDKDGRLWGCVAGDQGYAATHIVLKREDVEHLAVPQGFAIVPVIATRPMTIEAEKMGAGEAWAEDCWSAMLHAAQQESSDV